jgi:hypothetical protein
MMSEEEDLGDSTHNITYLALWVIVCDFVLWVAWVYNELCYGKVTAWNKNTPHC